MRRFYLLKIIILFIFSIYSSALVSLAQRPLSRGNQTAIIGWTDDNHYMLRTVDADQSIVIQSVDIKSGKAVVIPPKKSDRELLADALPQGYKLNAGDIVSPDMNSIVMAREKDLFYFSACDGRVTRLTNDNDDEVNTRFSPDGKKIAYTKNKDLYVYDLSASREIRLTSDATDKIYNGYAAWVYMEEILGRASRYAAFWWSPDGNKIAYLRTDETDVPVFTLNRLDEADGIHGLIEATPYPKPGDPNPKVKMGIADIESEETVWVQTDYSKDQYIAWPFWTPDSKSLAIQVVNRDQNDLKIILADPETGSFSQIYNESRTTWVDFFDDVYVMENGSGYLLISYRSGWKNIYHYGWDGRLIKQLTNLNFNVTEIVRVDEDKKILYFSATGEESTDKHYFRVGIDGRNLLQLTRGSGSHSLSISPGGNYFADTWNSIESAGSIITFDKRARVIREIHRFEQEPFDPSLHQKSEMVKIMTSDKLFNMPAIITFPVNFDPGKKYPVIFAIYGGPASKNVTNKWKGNEPSWNSLNGIITFTVDHRGSGHFGLRGLDYLHRSLGKWEISDYADAVVWLRDKPYIDSNRVGITGTSYGGYVTCLALTKGADYWTHGVAGMPVTDYRLYDNIYTERFMDTPQDNPDGYKEGSALTYAENLKGKFYIFHGEMDDNVHMQNSIYLISRLQDYGKSFEFMIYPGGRHGWGGPKALHMRNEVNDFWLRNFFDN